MNATKQMLDTKEAAEVLGVSAPTLYSWRCRGTDGIPFARISGRCVRYRRADLDQWISDRMVGATTAASAARG